MRGRRHERLRQRQSDELRRAVAAHQAVGDLGLRERAEHPEHLAGTVGALEPSRQAAGIGQVARRQPLRAMQRDHRHRLVSLLGPGLADHLRRAEALGIPGQHLRLPLRRQPRQVRGQQPDRQCQRHPARHDRPGPSAHHRAQGIQAHRSGSPRPLAAIKRSGVSSEDPDDPYRWGRGFGVAFLAKSKRAGQVDRDQHTKDRPEHPSISTQLWQFDDLLTSSVCTGGRTGAPAGSLPGPRVERPSIRADLLVCIESCVIFQGPRRPSDRAGSRRQKPADAPRSRDGSRYKTRSARRCLGVSSARAFRAAPCQGTPRFSCWSLANADAAEWLVWVSSSAKTSASCSWARL